MFPPYSDIQEQLVMIIKEIIKHKKKRKENYQVNQFLKCVPQVGPKVYIPGNIA